MTSDSPAVYVWTWLPGATKPVVAGRLDPAGNVLAFTYGQSYLAREDAIPLYLPELPLGENQTVPLTTGDAAGAITDAAPDAWGQRVILNRVVGRAADDTPTLDLTTYLLESGSNRVGALDFQRSPTDYIPRSTGAATLAELIESADRVEQGVPLSEALDQALLHGTSVGGARPKATLTDGSRELIAKFSSSTDPYSVVKGEFVAMTLARRAGLDVAPVELRRSGNKDVLLVERFDRPAEGGRQAMVSALTILELAEHEARYASYADLAEIVRGRFTEPQPTLRELFSRITFNILTGNTDDHARNHAAFWDGQSLSLTLTPAYDICPQGRTGQTAKQVMDIGTDGYRDSQLAGCVERATTYGLTPIKARELVDRQIEVIRKDWDEVSDQASLTKVDRGFFWKRQFLNPYAFYGYDAPAQTAP